MAHKNEAVVVWVGNRCTQPEATSLEIVINRRDVVTQVEGLVKWFSDEGSHHIKQLLVGDGDVKILH